VQQAASASPHRPGLWCSRRAPRKHNAASAAAAPKTTGYSTTHQAPRTRTTHPQHSTPIEVCSSLAAPRCAGCRLQCSREYVLAPSSSSGDRRLGPLRPPRPLRPLPPPHPPQPPAIFPCVIRLCSQSILLSAIPHPHHSPFTHTLPDQSLIPLFVIQVPQLPSSAQPSTTPAPGTFPQTVATPPANSHLQSRTVG
jgi:hypothetical protein